VPLENVFGRKKSTTAVSPRSLKKKIFRAPQLVTWFYNAQILGEAKKIISSLREKTTKKRLVLFPDSQNFMLFFIETLFLN